jgi:hypothetical protein
VYFGTRPSSSFTVKSDKKIVAYSPAGTAGKVVIRVYTTSGVSAATVAAYYTYQIPAAVKKHQHRHRHKAG